jgi:hypothetical protein
VAVAAILIISAGITLYSIFNKQTNKGITPDGIVKKEQAPAPISTISPNKDDQSASVLKEDTEQKTVTNAVDKESNKEKEQQSQPEQKNDQQLDYNPPNENVTELQQPAITIEIDKANIAQPRIKDYIVVDEKMPKENFNADLVTIHPPEPPYEGSPENKKFRGFFRKATRLIERTTNINAADDDKVLIGGMAINLK